jgi:hypothetical protein
LGAILIFSWHFLNDEAVFVSWSLLCRQNRLKKKAKYFPLDFLSPELNKCPNSDSGYLFNEKIALMNEFNLSLENDKTSGEE